LNRFKIGNILFIGTKKAVTPGTHGGVPDVAGRRISRIKFKINRFTVPYFDFTTVGPRSGADIQGMRAVFYTVTRAVKLYLENKRRTH
jgi:hypothetical protein